MPKKHTQSNKVRKRKGKDLDEIYEDLRPEKIPKLLKQPYDPDLPGQAVFDCLDVSFFLHELSAHPRLVYFR